MNGAEPEIVPTMGAVGTSVRGRYCHDEGYRERSVCTTLNIRGVERESRREGQAHALQTLRQGAGPLYLYLVERSHTPKLGSCEVQIEQFY